VKRFLFAGILIGIIPMSSSTFAQEGQQTPENAQKFLALSWPSSFELWTDGIKTLTVYNVGKASSLKRVCHTDLDGRTPDGVVLNWGVMWSHVVDIKHSEGSNLIYIKEKNQRFIRKYDFQSPSLAARAAFAMEYLKQHCDPASATGF
jgi:hypothetical protein